MEPILLWVFRYVFSITAFAGWLMVYCGVEYRQKRWAYFGAVYSVVTIVIAVMGVLDDQPYTFLWWLFYFTGLVSALHLLVIAPGVLKDRRQQEDLERERKRQERIAARGAESAAGTATVHTTATASEPEPSTEPETPQQEESTKGARIIDF